ncbi:bifunctional homocysteine S-methyltransferase/methylenetetrahydrofolate reductase [bacterium]|nr:bifunctional homocysteine S-methyltransferase/methylenetetrahydrofolate reductase [bacterium]
MKKPFLETVNDRVLLADGAMGTEIYNRGFYVNRCYDQLNLTSANTIRDIHSQYAEAGAEILTTNTYGANRLHLESFGLADSLEEINRQGVTLAKEVAGDELYVAGSIGPIAKPIKLPADNDLARETFREQGQVLLDAQVDLILLETYVSLDQLELAFQAIRELDKDIPILPSVSLRIFTGSTRIKPEDYLRRIRGWDSNLIGINCGGPPESLEILGELSEHTPEETRISVMPSAGLPKVVDGRTLYLASPEYMAEFTRRFVQQGAGIVGGCCGTTPSMIKEMSSFLRSVQPGMSVSVVIESEKEDEVEKLPPIPIEERTPFGKILGTKFAVSVELDPPKGLDASKSVEGAKFLHEKGIDAVNIADGPRATGRMSPTALASLVRREVPIETIIHICCRDRNLLALQMDLVSMNALDLKNLMVITGDPPKMGIYPDATAVFDLDAIGLTACTNMLNQGLDFAHRPLKGQTSFVIGVGCNPGAPELDREVKRYEEKVASGAEFVFSQPVYNPEFLSTFLHRIEYVKKIPIFVGILPLASFKNAEFLHNEVPGMQVPDEIRERMRKAPTKEAQRQEGVDIAAEALKEAAKHPMIQGAYIFPPFGRYEAVIEVLEKAEVW